MPVQHHGPRRAVVHDAAQRHRAERVVRVVQQGRINAILRDELGLEVVSSGQSGVLVVAPVDVHVSRERELHPQNGREDLAGLVRRVAELFRDHVDLLKDFEHFLPFEEEDRDGAAKEALRGAVAAADGSGKKKRRRRT